MLHHLTAILPFYTQGGSAPRWKRFHIYSTRLLSTYYCGNHLYCGLSTDKCNKCTHPVSLGSGGGVYSLGNHRFRWYCALVTPPRVVGHTVLLWVSCVQAPPLTFLCHIPFIWQWHSPYMQALCEDMHKHSAFYGQWESAQSIFLL